MTRPPSKKVAKGNLRLDRVSDAARWNARYDKLHAQLDKARRGQTRPVEPTPFLEEALDFIRCVEVGPRVTSRTDELWLPTTATGEPPESLDLASGTGDDVLHLAQRGWRAHGVDVSDKATQILERRARDLELSVGAITADLETWCPGSERWHLVTCFKYLDRRALSRVTHALKPGGHLVFETFSTEHPRVSGGRGPGNSRFLLDPNEVPSLLEDLQLLHRADLVEPTGDGSSRALIRLIARRPVTGPVAECRT